MAPAQRIAIGIIGRPVGLEGFCAVEALGATLAALKPPCAVLVGKDPNGAESAALEEIVARGGGYQCRFAGMGDREAVGKLRGAYLFIEENALPPLPENTFYHDELKGMEVCSDIDGKHLGTVIEVHNLPSADTLEVRLEDGASILLPLLEQAVVAIERAGRRITVRQSFVEELLE
jgi:16S rRNA processing protein RimM